MDWPGCWDTGLHYTKQHAQQLDSQEVIATMIAINPLISDMT